MREKQAPHHSVVSMMVATKIILVCLLLFATVTTIIYIPPTSFMIIGVFIALITLNAILMTSFFFSTTYQFIAGVGVLLFCVINMLTGFQIINNLLLLSGIIGTIIFIRQK